jgi:AraC-like DNA-binding protein
MSTHTSSDFFANKLRNCGLFTIYSRAFEVATGYQLSLSVQDGGGAASVPVRVGDMTPFFLIAEGEGNERKDVFMGLLKSFALQLEDEVNRSFLESDDAEPKCVRETKIYIKEHFGERITLDRVSEGLGVCPFQLCRLFKKHTGMTMTEYASRYRVEKARKILQDPRLQISKVATMVGFTSISQFNRNFLKYAGESPSRYRLGLGALEHCQLLAV